MDLGVDLSPAQMRVALSQARYKLIGGAMGGGKALALDTPLPTPTGWTTMGEVERGDFLLDERGIPCEVLTTSSVMHGHPVYEVRFKDGSVIVADAEHRWLTDDRASRMSQSRQRRRTRKDSIYARDQRDMLTQPKVRTTEELANTLRAGTYGDLNHSVIVAAPLQLPSQEFPLDPYLLGVWLGDGTTNEGQITSADVEIFAAFEQAGYALGGRNGKYTQTILTLRGDLGRLGVRGNKHIPQEYLRGSIGQRLALLQGLMDTDGTCLPSGQCEFYSTNRALIDGCYELLVSLGVRCRVSEGIAKLDGREVGPKYRIKFMAPFPAFRLARKLSRQKFPERPLQHVRMITDVRPVPSVPVRCVGVDSPSHLYLAGRSMIPTHNTLDLAVEAIDLLVSYPGNVGFMGRNDLQDLKKTTLREFLKRLPPALLIQHHQTEQWIDVQTADPRYPSRLYYGELKDPDSLLSMNLGFFIIDEAFEVGRYAFRNLASRLRHILPDGTYPYYCGLLGSNPAPCWLMDLFPVLPNQQAEVKAGVFARPQYAYFPMTMFDNPFLPPDYVKEQQELYADDPVLYDRFVKGVWSGMLQGLVYDLRPWHRWTRPSAGERLWRPGLPVELAVDPSGGAAPYAVNVIQQVGPYVCIIDQFYEDGASDEDVFDWLKAKPFGQRTNIADVIIDPAARSSIDRWQNHGYPARGLTRQKEIRGQINAVKGIMRRNPASGYASLLIDEDYCPHLINEFGLYSYSKLTDTKRAEGNLAPEKPEDKHNHAINALEYWTLEKRVVADMAGQQRKRPTRRKAAYESMLAEVMR